MNYRSVLQTATTVIQKAGHLPAQMLDQSICSQCPSRGKSKGLIYSQVETAQFRIPWHRQSRAESSWAHGSVYRDRAPRLGVTCLGGESPGDPGGGGRGQGQEPVEGRPGSTGLLCSLGGSFSHPPTPPRQGGPLASVQRGSFLSPADVVIRKGLLCASRPLSGSSGFRTRVWTAAHADLIRDLGGALANPLGRPWEAASPSLARCPSEQVLQP